MILSVEKLKQFIKTEEPEEVLTAKLQALELLIRKHTNNNFQVRAIRSAGTFKDGKLYCDTSKLKDGDTVQISESEYNEGLMTVSGMEDGAIQAAGSIDEEGVLVTKVYYPPDIVMGAVNMLKWDLENREKVGVQSETISRHSVTYFNMDGDNSSLGYPKSLVGFMQPYKKARF